MKALDDLIYDLKAGKRRAQSVLYKEYAPALLGLCMRYSKSKAEAEDVLQEGFIKIFEKVGKLQKTSSLVPWMKRIMVNTAINSYHKNLKHYYHQDIDEVQIDEADGVEKVEYLSGISPEVVMKAVQELPEGYKMVLNMYVFDGFSHKEIAEELNISVNTSKTQLLKARKKLKTTFKKAF
ncbi:MAG: RNA polymerase subunit sigma [Bacteroidetes bacterium 4572_77]|nr:MAG: RNA polymerase subunit sigma [Bacteroidetes bacterium 4572_77]